LIVQRHFAVAIHVWVMNLLAASMLVVTVLPANTKNQRMIHLKQGETNGQ
jgi:hypothetical protein